MVAEPDGGTGRHQAATAELARVTGRRAAAWCGVAWRAKGMPFDVVLSHPCRLKPAVVLLHELTSRLSNRCVLCFSWTWDRERLKAGGWGVVPT